MILAEYKDLNQIYDGKHSQVYRAQRDRQPVILKILKPNEPTPNQIRRCRQEYLSHQIKLPNLVEAYDLHEWERTLVIVFEDFGGTDLHNLYQQKVGVKEFLGLALKIVEALGQLHGQGMIHKDINPSNLVLNPETGVLKLIDLGISTQLSRENPVLKTPHALEGTLSYMSPEQTGRMNRILDYRTDFYSLGVTFYELLTGKLPFAMEDTMELIHAHIAKQPVPPCQFGVPQTLSDLVMKLMAKNAEDRYSSTWGLQADLIECLQQWQTSGTIANFQLGKHDISDQFQIPQKLYGRAYEIQELMRAFERVSSQEVSCSELVLVAGYSGIGKSALVQELYKPITAKKGRFISGKFDQVQRNIPYLAVVDAFTGLVKQLLGEPEPVLNRWRSRLLEALGDNGQLVIDLIPDLGLIIGAQAPVLSLGAHESQNRFNLVLQSFIRVFCRVDHPLVIFLDDLQWADMATLNLLQLLLGDIQYLLVIGAYRDYEMGADHPLMIAIAKLKSSKSDFSWSGQQLIRKGCAITEISLKPLVLAQIAQLITETLHCKPEPKTQIINELAELVLRKTEGNPFFINEFLKTLHRDHLLVFNSTSRTWTWQLSEIEEIGFTDNVVELLVQQIQKMAKSVQESLSIAACLGNEFDLGTLALVSNRDLKAVSADLETAEAMGFLRSGSALDQDFLIQDYQFEHDRIQQAAYLLISDQEKVGIHYQIGQLWLQQLPPSVLEERLFAVVNHLNYGINGINLITCPVERDHLAQLNLSAGRKARSANAYQSAIQYAAIGLDLLGSESWQRQYALTLTLHELGAEAAALCGEFDQMERLIQQVYTHARTTLDKLKVYIIKIHALTSQNQLLDAVELGQRVLCLELGIEFPVGDSAVTAAIQTINTLIGDRAIAQLKDLPSMVDPNQLAIMEVAASIMPSCYLSGSPLFPLVAALLVNLSIQYGNSPDSAYSYAAYGIVLNQFQDVNTASEFGRLAHEIAQTAKNIQAETLMVIGIFLHHRQSHLQETLNILQAGYQAALATGKLEYVGHNINSFCVHSYWCGQPLAELEIQVRNYRTQLLNLNQLTMANHCVIIWETTQFLLGKLDQAIALDQNLISDDLYRAFNFYLHKSFLNLLVGDILQANADAVQARDYITGGKGTIAEPRFYFYDSVIALAMISNSSNDRSGAWQEILSHRVQSNQDQLQAWVDHAPINHLATWQLVEAEKCRVLGQKLEAIELYDQAIAGAKTNQYIQNEALGNELAAKFYLSWGKEMIARAYMTEAHYCYLRWGAIAKTNQLTALYPQWFTTSTIANPPALDLSSVMKSSQAIASQIVLEDLLQTLMKILLENAGAQIGWLLLHKKSGQFAIAAGSRADGQPTVISSQAIEQIMPESVLNYVARTKLNVILNNATKDGDFSRDRYLQSAKPLSVICYPLIDQGNLVAIVYLENNITTGAFSSDRIELLQLLSGQAAIAISNAQLYAKVKESEQQLQQFLEAMPIGIGVLDENGHPYYTNQKAVELLGKGTEPETISSEITKVYQTFRAGTNQHYPNQELPVVRALNGEVSNVEDIEIHNGDRTIPIEAWGRPIYNAAGDVQYAITVFQDITQRQEVAKILTDYNSQLKQQVDERTAELTTANQELVHATRLKDEFLANMSHELRTPLNAILGMSEGLQNQTYGEINQEQRDSLGTIESSGTHLLELITDILDVSKIEAGMLKLELILMSVRDLCDSSLIFIKQQAWKKNIQLKLEIPTDLGEIWIDRRRIRQVLINLLSNAVKFTPNGGKVTLEVKLETIHDLLSASSQTWLWFSVIDNGIGIANNDLERLFKPFVQIDSSLSRQYEGTGLGLTLVKQIAELHGGRVDVNSKEGEGSCFSVWLPYEPDLTALPLINPCPEAIESLNHPDHLILLVENNPTSAITFRNYLESRGYRLILAENANQAMEIAIAQLPDLILIDLQMPLMNIMNSAIAQIRAHSQVIPIIALTTEDCPLENGQNGLEANAYLSKPVKLKQLVSTIERLLSTK